MKLQFDANQEYQLDAIKAAVDLFAGQPVGSLGTEDESLPEWWTDSKNHPWGIQTAETEELQVLTNMLLKDQGYCPIEESGKLDAATCGAAGHVGLPMPSTCENLTPPSKWMCGNTTNYSILGGILAASSALVLINFERRNGHWEKR